MVIGMFLFSQKNTIQTSILKIVQVEVPGNYCYVRCACVLHAFPFPAALSLIYKVIQMTLMYAGGTSCHFYQSQVSWQSEWPGESRVPSRLQTNKVSC